MSHWSAAGSARKSKRLSDSTANRLSGGDFLDQMVQELQHVVLSSRRTTRKAANKRQATAQCPNREAVGPKNVSAEIISTIASAPSVAALRRMSGPSADVVR